MQHAVKTLIKTLQPADRLSLVTFNESAALELELTAMTEAGQEQAVAKLMTFRAYGRTNIWDGVLKGMESLRGPSDPNHDRGESERNDGRQKAILLLTDGKPNISPPSGTHGAAQLQDEHPDFAFQLNSFGFGYNLDSALLLELAEEGGGPRVHPGRRHRGHDLRQLRRQH